MNNVLTCSPKVSIKAFGSQGNVVLADVTAGKVRVVEKKDGGKHQKWP